MAGLPPPAPRPPDSVRPLSPAPSRISDFGLPSDFGFPPLPLAGTSMRKGALIAFALIVLLALGLRCPRLGQRPMHNDEAVNGIKFGQVWDARLARPELYGPYRYDPREYHGPVLVYATAALAWLSRAPDLNRVSEARLRLVPLLAGLGL